MPLPSRHRAATEPPPCRHRAATYHPLPTKPNLPPPTFPLPGRAQPCRGSGLRQRRPTAVPRRRSRTRGVPLWLWSYLLWLYLPWPFLLCCTTYLLWGILLTTHYSLLATHYSLLTTTHYSLLTTHYSLLTTHYSLLATRYSLLTAHCLLLTTAQARLYWGGLRVVAVDARRGVISRRPKFVFFMLAGPAVPVRTRTRGLLDMGAIAAVLQVGGKSS